MSFYDNMAATATKLLTKFGANVTLSRVTGGSTNPITGAIVAGVDASVVSKGLIKPYPDNMIDDTRVLASDRLLVLDASNDVLPSDKPIIGGEAWSIVNIKTVKPTDTSVVYFVQVRR